MTSDIKMMSIGNFKGVEWTCLYFRARQNHYGLRIGFFHPCVFKCWRLEVILAHSKIAVTFEFKVNKSRSP